MFLAEGEQLTLNLFDDKLQQLLEIYKTQNEDEKRSFNELQDEDIVEMLLTVEAVFVLQQKKVCSNSKASNKSVRRKRRKRKATCSSILVLIDDTSHTCQDLVSENEHWTEYNQWHKYEHSSSTVMSYVMLWSMATLHFSIGYISGTHFRELTASWRHILDLFKRYQRALLCYVIKNYKISWLHNHNQGRTQEFFFRGAPPVYIPLISGGQYRHLCRIYSHFVQSLGG